MGAPKGNQFWKIRSTHGRDKLFASAELLWEAASEYFEWADENPLMESRPFVTSNGNNNGSSVENQDVPHKRPYTIHALCLYLDCGINYFRQFKQALKDKQDDPASKDFSLVISKIEETIYNQKFEGAASGFFNANIISRDLGLIDQKNVGLDIPTEKKINISIDGKDIDLSK